MADQYVEYVTQEGDRWDLIAHKHYGDRWAFERIIQRNRHVPIRPVLRGGITLKIPVIDAATAAQRRDVPPWKRG